MPFRLRSRITPWPTLLLIAAGLLTSLLYAQAGPTATPTSTPTLTLDATLRAVVVEDPAGALAGAPLVGPLSGQITYALPGQRSLVARQPAGVFTDNFVTEARFFNPFDADAGQWDYGFFFRQGQRGWSYRLIVDSRRVWALQASVPGYRLVEVGALPNLRLAAGEANTLRLAVSGAQGVFFVNDAQVAVLDLSLMQDYGEVFVTVCAYQESCPFASVEGDLAVRFADFRVWPIGPALRLTPPPTATRDPAVQTAEAQATSVIATASAEAAATQAVATNEAALDLTATPVPVGQLRPGRDNVGQIAPGEAQVWTLNVDSLDTFSISILADWHPRLALYWPDGRLWRVDDSYSRLLGVRPVLFIFGFLTGEYRVVVRGATGQESGPYRLSVTRNSLATPTPTP